MQFTTQTAARIVGASVRQLRYWDKQHLLKPSGKAVGHRRYTFVDLVALKTILRLKGQGLSLQRIGKAVRYLRKHYPHAAEKQVLASLTLLTDGQQLYLLTDSQEIQEVLTRQSVMKLAIGQIAQETMEQVEAMPLEWTESVKVGRRPFHLLVTRDPASGTHTVQCRELPGAIEQGDTADEAIEAGKDAIASALAFMKQHGRRSGRGRARA